MVVQFPELVLERRRVLWDGLDVEAELGEEVPGQLVDAGVLDGVERGVGELALNVVNDLLNRVDRFLPDMSKKIG